jgi:hypothetical protein
MIHIKSSASAVTQNESRVLLAYFSGSVGRAAPNEEVQRLQRLEIDEPRPCRSGSCVGPSFGDSAQSDMDLCMGLAEYLMVSGWLTRQQFEDA